MQAYKRRLLNELKEMRAVFDPSGPSAGDRAVSPRRRLKSPTRTRAPVMHHYELPIMCVCMCVSVCVCMHVGACACVSVCVCDCVTKAA